MNAHFVDHRRFRWGGVRSAEIISLDGVVYTLERRKSTMFSPSRYTLTQTPGGELRELTRSEVRKVRSMFGKVRDLCENVNEEWITA